MNILLVAVGAVILIWIITFVIQSLEKKSREEDIKKRLEEKKKEEERKNSFGNRG